MPMTASIERIDYDILRKNCARITAEVPVSAEYAMKLLEAGGYDRV